MGKLRDQMIMELELRNRSPNTIKAYVGHMVSFVKYFNKSPDLMGENEIRQYLHYLVKQKKASWSSINISYNAFKFFYTKTLHRKWNVEHIPRPKGSNSLPIVLSRSEVIKIFDSTRNKKHRVILMTTYSAGLRVSEVAHLKVANIDSSRMTIFVEKGKGQKDRYINLSEVLLKELREYYKRYRPQKWLFPGQNPTNPIDKSTIQTIFRKAKEKANIKKAATTHTLRHSFATHFLEDGGNIFRLKQLLGHSYLATTMTYVHLQNIDLTKVVSPLDRIMESEK